jgi:hypothetical protein
MGIKFGVRKCFSNLCFFVIMSLVKNEDILKQQQIIRANSEKNYLKSPYSVDEAAFLFVFFEEI